VAGIDDEVSRETRLAAARAVLDEVLRHLGSGFAVSVAFDETEQLTTFVISGPESGTVVGRHGDTLDAIEHLLNRIAAGTPGVPGRVAVDVDGYRARRRESLEQLALRLAEKARSTRRAVTLHPMSPRDRRIVHLALSDAAGVSTHSEGEGHYRRVVIEPA
jgi:spoIIIJ-associated protein